MIHRITYYPINLAFVQHGDSEPRLHLLVTRASLARLARLVARYGVSASRWYHSERTALLWVPEPA